jgi:hypothetical protein
MLSNFVSAISRCVACKRYCQSISGMRKEKNISSHFVFGDCCFCVLCKKYLQVKCYITGSLAQNYLNLIYSRTTKNVSFATKEQNWRALPLRTIIVCLLLGVWMVKSSFEQAVYLQKVMFIQPKFLLKIRQAIWSLWN